MKLKNQDQNKSSNVLDFGKIFEEKYGLKPIVVDGLDSFKYDVSFLKLKTDLEGKVAFIDSSNSVASLIGKNVYNIGLDVDKISSKNIIDFNSNYNILKGYSNLEKNKNLAEKSKNNFIDIESIKSKNITTDTYEVKEISVNEDDFTLTKKENQFFLPYYKIPANNISYDTNSSMYQENLFGYNCNNKLDLGLEKKLLRESYYNSYLNFNRQKAANYSFNSYYKKIFRF